MYSVCQKASVTLGNRNVGSGKNREKWMLEEVPHQLYFHKKLVK